MAFPRRLLLILLLTVLPALPHIGSPDIFFDGMAGPYPVLIVIRPPQVIPGTAQVEIRTSTPGIQSVKLLPMPLSGAGSKFPPTADVASRSSVDPNLFTGQLWMMASGSWQVKFDIVGDRGTGEVAVPVPAIATAAKGMDKGLGALLIGLTLFLVVGLVSIAGAAVRESTLPAGATPEPTSRRKSRNVMLATAGFAVVALWGGAAWWNSEAGKFNTKLYKPLDLHATVRPGHLLQLQLSDSAFLPLRKLDDLVLDHDHLMHLYAIREPNLDAVFHLHPEQVHPGAFELALPPMPLGRYKLFADIVHDGGLGETSVSEMDITSPEGTPLSGDNAGGMIAPLPDGTRMVWVHGKDPIHAGQVQRFVFRFEDATGKPLADLEPYMGMAGHAAFVSRDFTTFAHIHPVGSAPMPALMMTAASMASMHQMPSGADVSFPYAFPKPGRYRIFVQMKRAGTIQTAAFDVEVE